MKPILVACAFLICGALPEKAAAQQAPLPPNAEAAIGAATSFAVGYGVWLWEKKCRKLPAAEWTAFDATVTQQMQRLSGVLDLQMFNAILGAGQDTAKDTTNTPSCEDAGALDFARFGVDMVKDSGAKLATIPPDYHLVIAN